MSPPRPDWWCGGSFAVQPISYRRHRFPAEVIRYGAWLYLRFTLSFRDVEELLAERGIEVSYETIRCWTLKFGPLIARNLRRRQARPTGRWRVDKMVVKIGGAKRWPWRAVDDEGVVLDMLIQPRRNRKAALRLFRKLMKTTGVHPETITTDKLASYGAALRGLNLSDRNRCRGRRANNQVENSHLPIRRPERKMQTFKSDHRHLAPPDQPTRASHPAGRSPPGVGASQRRSRVGEGRPRVLCARSPAVAA